MKPRIRYLAGLVAPAAGPALRPPRQLFDAGTYQPGHSPVSNHRQRTGEHAGPHISGAPVHPVPSAGAPPSLPEESRPGDRPAADRAFTAPGHSRPPPAAGSSLAPDLVPPSGAPAIPGTAPAPSAPPMAAVAGSTAAPGSAAPHAGGEGTGPATGTQAVRAGQEKPGRSWTPSPRAGVARTEPPSAGPAAPPASAAHDPAVVRSERPPSGRSWSLADGAVAPWPESRSAARQGRPTGLPPADRGIVPGRPGGPDAFPDLLPPPAPAPHLTEQPQPDTGGLRHRSRPPQPHRVSIGTIEVTVVPPAPPAHRIPPPARPAPVPSRRAAQPDGSGGPHRFRRWYGTAQS